MQEVQAGYKERHFHHEDSQVLPKEVVQSPSLKVFRTQLLKDLSSLFSSHRWPPPSLNRRLTRDLLKSLPTCDCMVLKGIWEPERYPLKEQTQYHAS